MLSRDQKAWLSGELAGQRRSLEAALQRLQSIELWLSGLPAAAPDDGRAPPTAELSGLTQADALAAVLAGRANRPTRACVLIDEAINRGCRGRAGTAAGRLRQSLHAELVRNSAFEQVGRGVYRLAAPTKGDKND